MELRPLGGTGVRVSEVALGAMTFGREASEPDSRAMLDRYLEAGGNFVDTADVYGGGSSEEILGRVFAERAGLRDQVVLATKFRMPTAGGTANDAGGSRRHIRASIERSLRRLRTDWVDLYQMHAWDPRTPLDETLSTLDDLVHEGKVRYLGASNYAAWQLERALGRAGARGWEPFTSLQPQYSLVCRDIEREVLPCARHEGLAVLPWSPLGGGLLTGKYRRGERPTDDTRAGDDSTPSGLLVRMRLDDERNDAVVESVRSVATDSGHSPAQVALNWVLHRRAVTAPIVGARTLAQLDDNLGALGWRLDEEHRRQLDDVSAIPLGYPYEFISAGKRR
jgi:aryl-alcohol dehydrogenase-like predicted oxidoreductase